MRRKGSLHIWGELSANTRESCQAGLHQWGFVKVNGPPPPPHLHGYTPAEADGRRRGLKARQVAALCGGSRRQTSRILNSVA